MRYSGRILPEISLKKTKMPKSQLKPISPFAKKVYSLISTIPVGKISTYKYVAQTMNTKAYQAIGQVLRCNPFAPEVPCHRIVASDGKIGGFAGKRTGENIKKKIALLKKEGVEVANGKVMDFEKVLHKF